MTNKYVNKKWADNENWSHDPAWLYENKPAKFQKYLAYYKKAQGIPTEEPPNSDDEVVEAKKPAGSKFSAPPKTTQPMNLLDFDAPAKSAVTNDIFSNNTGAASTQADEGFNDFQGT